jgi:hypothetical protein
MYSQTKYTYKIHRYGINTGFGLFSDVVIPPHQLKDLQVNLIRSHSAGVGPNLSRERTRMMLALRINVLSKGHSGISRPTLEKLLLAFNKVSLFLSHHQFRYIHFSCMNRETCFACSSIYAPHQTLIE